MISHGNELLSELNRLHCAPKPGLSDMHGSFEFDVRIAAFNEELAQSLPNLQPQVASDTCGRAGIDVPGSSEAEVDAYLADEDLSSDKTPVINVDASNTTEPCATAVPKIRDIMPRFC